MTENSVNSKPRQLHLLVVDDNTINIRLMSAALTRQGHLVDSADDGTVAVTKFTENHYDAILMDIMMPVMDGISATREIRRIETERQSTTDQRVKIIAITANAFEDDRSKLFEAGMDHYMTKPIDITELQRLLSL